jgi:4-carboxymuconolactone decarboxylase
MDPVIPSTPRLTPLADDEADPRQAEVIADLVRGPTVNIYRTLARHPDAAAAMVNFGRTLRSGSLSARHREILILRSGWNCSSAYEFAQHRRIALESGMTLDDLRRIQEGPDGAGWDPFELALCRMADELHDTGGVTDDTWKQLAAGYDERELIEAVLLVGYYHLVSFALNALGVPLEAGAESFVE